MKILGVIMECNPFHSGHAYFIRKAKELCNADFCVAVMSGDYVQRGFPACFPKELRTEVLLKNGADLVLELPVAFSTGSAEYFASAGIALLDKLGCIDYLCFGRECGDIETFKKAADLLANASGSLSDTSGLSSNADTYFSDALAQKLKEGKSFPVARYEVLASMPQYREYLSLFESPNNILGIEYCQALLLRDSKIKPLTFKREGSGYHDLAVDDTEFASASGLRKAFADISHSLADQYSATDISTNAFEEAVFRKQIPENCYELYTNALRNNAFIDADDFSLLLSKQVLFSDIDKLTSYQDVNIDFAQKLSTLGTKQTSFMAYCDAMKSKNYTHTRISRSLLHIILEITKESVEKQVAMDYVSYARILGFRKDASELLSHMKKQTSIPLISKLADAESILNTDSLAQLRQTLTASHLYSAVLASKSGKKMQHECAKQIVIV